MNRLGFLLLVPVGLVPMSALHATTAYKCVDARGAISFQDRPCARGSTQQTIALPDSPAPASAAAPAPPPPDAPPADAAPPLASTAAPAIPPPDFYLCTRYNGQRYISEDGRGGSALVPLGVMGVPGRSLADAYGGPNGIGVSAPGLRTIPHMPAGSTPFASMSTWVDDECHKASPQEACAYLRGSLDDVRYKLTKAFSDTTPALKRQEADLVERLRGC